MNATAPAPATPRGRVVRDQDGVRLEFVRTYAEPVESVWAALTEPERTARWFGPWTGDPATGTVQVSMTAEEAGEAQAVQILECTPPTRLSVVATSPDGPWHLSATLRERDGGTELTFVHVMAEPYDASAIGPGWQFYLDRLDAAVLDKPVPADFDAYYPALAGAYAVPD